MAVAIDPHGDEYVASSAGGDDAKSRIDVFDDEGHFVTAVAPVPKPKSIAVDSEGTLYVFENSGDIVRYAPSKYDPEAGEIEYETAPAAVASVFFVGALAIDASNDQLIVAHQGNITRYKSAKEGNGELESFAPVGIGSWTESIAVDAQRRRIYVSFCKDLNHECGVMVVGADPPHAILAELDGSNTPAGEFFALSSRLGLAVDEETGDFFVTDMQPAKKVYQFSEDYEYRSELASSEFQAFTLLQIAVSNGEREVGADPCEYPVKPAPPAGDACNRHYLFIPVVKSNGRVLAYHPSDIGPPLIERVSTDGIGETEAELQAVVDPEGAKTNYVIEITTQESFESEGFAGAVIVGEGVIPGDNLATEVATHVSNLQAGSAYRFRARAENEVGAASEEGQSEATFATYDDAEPPLGCSNQPLRVGPSARLPDCRAYELVTPSETTGHPPRGVGYVGSLFTTVHSSPAGGSVYFKIEGGSLPGSSGVGNAEGDPYLATRGSSGWSSVLAGPTGEEVTTSIPASVSPDQEYLFWNARAEGPLVVNGEETEYLRYPDGHSELIGRGTLGTDPKVKGKLITENATHVVFETNNLFPTVAVQLEPNAPPSGIEAVYDRTIDPDSGAETTHVVSLLPGDVTPSQNAEFIGASKDGEGIAFEIGTTLYLRSNNETTFQIGTGVEFAGVSEGGGRIFYVQGGNLKAFDTSSEEVIDFSSAGNVTPVNVANNGARAYFVSESVLGGANPEGDEAQAKAQNLYLSEEGAISYVATVTDRDVEGDGLGDGLGLWTEVGSQIARDPSRTNPDGSLLLFQSRADITGYPESEFPQIYRYDSSADRLHCISCIPTGVPATGGASLESYTYEVYSPRPFSPNAFVHNLTPDGKRVFFESTEALVSDDTDEVRDVYEWEENGVGSCDREEGCIYLISSGRSARDNFLYAHSTSGNDVFFTTGDALTGLDTGGSVSIYDARVNGGFPEPTATPPCVGDACPSSIASPPALPSAESASQGPSGNLNAPGPRSCPKNKRKVKKNGKVRCVKKKQKQKGGKAKQRASANRGAGK